MVAAGLDAWTRGKPEAPLDAITSKTLVIAPDDPFIPPSLVASAVAARIAGATLELALFETDQASVAGLHARGFWVDEEEHDDFLSTMSARGRVDDLEVRLRSARGRVFWARLSAQGVRFCGQPSHLGGIVDVTEARQARKNLSEVFRSAPVALVLSRSAGLPSNAPQATRSPGADVRSAPGGWAYRSLRTAPARARCPPASAGPH